jgi:phosphoglycerate kinase
MELAIEILKLAKEKGVQIHIPIDVVAADSFSNDAKTQIVDVKNIPDGWQGLDAGPKSLEIFDRILQDSKTILWNGPLGVFEMETFSKGTIQLVNSIAKSTENGAFSLVGGGDSVAAVKQFGLEPKMLEGRTLPGIAAILN